MVRVEIEMSPEMRLEMEMSADMWHRWVTQAEDCERLIRALAGRSPTLRDVLRNQRRDSSMTTSMRRAWVLCPVSLVALARGGRSEKQDSGVPRPRGAEVAPCGEPVDG